IGEMARAAADTDKAKNIIVLGLIAGWFDIARESILRGIREKFAKKGPELLAANERAFVSGELYAREHPLKTPRNLGRPAACATSGPGLSLKTEMMGLATIAELPLVIVDVQRGGPSTGLPTKSEQSDLFQAAFSAHGDVVRPILAPTTVSDTFDITVEAFNLA